MQFDTERWNLRSLISLAEDTVTVDTPANKALVKGEAATAEPMEVTAKDSLTNEATLDKSAVSVKEKDVNTYNLRELDECRKTRTGMEQKALEMDRIPSPKDEMRKTF